MGLDYLLNQDMYINKFIPKTMPALDGRQSSGKLQAITSDRSRQGHTQFAAHRYYHPYHYAPHNAHFSSSVDTHAHALNIHGISNRKQSSSSNSAKTFQCRTCAKSFASSSNLKGHITTVHEDFHQYSCSIFGMSFGLKQNLDIHIQVKHEKKRPYCCDVCGSGFGYKHVIQNHLQNRNGLPARTGKRKYTEYGSYCTMNRLGFSGECRKDTEFVRCLIDI